MDTNQAQSPRHTGLKPPPSEPPPSGGYDAFGRGVASSKFAPLGAWIETQPSGEVIDITEALNDRRAEEALLNAILGKEVVDSLRGAAQDDRGKSHVIA